MEEMVSAIAAETDPKKAEKIAKDFETKIDDAENKLEKSIEDDFNKSVDEIEKEFKSSLPLETSDEDPNVDFKNKILNTDSENLARNYLKKEFIDLAKSLKISYKGMKEIELINQIKFRLNEM